MYGCGLLSQIEEISTLTYGSRVLTRQRHDDYCIIVVGDGNGQGGDADLLGQSRCGLLSKSV